MNPNLSSYTYDTPLGKLTLVADSTAIIRILYAEYPVGIVQATPIIYHAMQEIREYLLGKRQQFSLKLKPQGTPFQQLTWQALQQIPYGETRTYRQIAEAIGKPQACRAVGLANHCNSIPIIIPCHRVIGANGTLTGYAGGLDKKQFLLSLEQQNTS